MAEDQPAGIPATRSQSIEGNADVVGAGPGVGPRSVSTDAATEAAIQQGIATSGAAALPSNDKSVPGALPADQAGDARSNDLARIQPGWQAYGSDGELIGPVGAVMATHFVILGASSAGADMYIPVDYIETIANQRVILNRPKPLLLDMKLDVTPVPAEAVERPSEAGLSAESAQGPTLLSSTGINSEGRDGPVSVYQRGAMEGVPEDAEARGTRFTPKLPHEPMPTDEGRPTKIRALNIATGWTVEDADGLTIGVVDGFTADSLKIQPSGGDELFVPMQSIANAADGVVHLQTAGPQSPALSPNSGREGENLPAAEHPDYAPAAAGVDEGDPTPAPETSAGEPRIGLTSPIERTPAGERDERGIASVSPQAGGQGARADRRFGEAGYASSQLAAEQEPVGRVSDLVGRRADEAAQSSPAVEEIVEETAVETRMAPDVPFAPRNLPVGASPIGATDASGINLNRVEEGWKVYDNDQNEIGEVEVATSRFLRLRHGWLFTHRLYIPDELVGSVDAEHQRVFLTQTKETIHDMDLSTPPPEDRSVANDQSTAWEREREQSEEQSSGIPYFQDSQHRDAVDGPTRQPSVAPNYTPIRGQPTGYEPFRSPQEHNETTTDLRTNVAPGGDPFGSQEANEGKPIPPGAPSAAERELPE